MRSAEFAGSRNARTRRKSLAIGQTNIKKEFSYNVTFEYFAIKKESKILSREGQNSIFWVFGHEPAAPSSPSNRAN
jgi:hypothetical protein